MSQVGVLFFIFSSIIFLSACGSGSGSSVFTPEKGHPQGWVDPVNVGTDKFHGSHVKVTSGQPEGAALYARKCADCHGKNGSGGKGPNIQGRTAEDIQSAIDRVIYMRWLKSLTSENIKAIASFLAIANSTSIEPSIDMVDTDACAECHGANLDGGIAKVSCYSCHSGPDGKAGHAYSMWLSGKNDPLHFHGYYGKDFAVACTACHGLDLKGPVIPSCFNCHDGSEWKI